MSTPSSLRRSSRKGRGPTTPGEVSVASGRSAASTGSGRGGVPWNIQKAFAQEIETAFPLAVSRQRGLNPIQALYQSSPQALIKFLKKLSREDPDNEELFEARKDQISNLCQYWKRKTLDQFDILWSSFDLSTGTAGATHLFASSPPAAAPKKGAQKKRLAASKRKTAPPPLSPDSVESDLSSQNNSSSSSSSSSATPPRRQEIKKQHQSTVPPKKISVPTTHQPLNKKPLPSTSMTEAAKTLAKNLGTWWHAYSHYSATAFFSHIL